MLFSSALFVYVFLPAVVAGFYILGHRRPRVYAKWFLIVASLAYYASWSVGYVPFFVGSVIANYHLGAAISAATGRTRRSYFALGVGLNLVVLGYFKYFNFFIDNVNLLIERPLSLEAIVLPVGISFYTFRQISFLSDQHRGRYGTQDTTLLDYVLFVGVFPHLLAGPITTYRELAPQLNDRTFGRLKNANLLIGLGLFFVGLFKKVVVADNLALYSAPVFSVAASGSDVAFATAWSGALVFTFQMYFDFSGYSDMAVGTARMLGLKLPGNFYSPLKATSTIDFWRRWHITLGRFITAEIFLPLNLVFARVAARHFGTPAGAFAVASGIPTMITFVLVGLWHGAGWPFIVFGIMHGLFMVVNLAWRRLGRTYRSLRMPDLVNWLVTFVTLVLSLAVFGAPDLSSGVRLLASMCSPDIAGTSQALVEFTSRALDLSNWLLFHKFGFEQYLVLAAIIALGLPNVAQVLWKYSPYLLPLEMKADARAWTLRWRPNWAGLAVLAALSVVALLNMTGSNAFLYFQF
ncbi:MAG: MBOAT family protein [Vicinamibacterales bacterium]